LAFLYFVEADKNPLFQLLRMSSEIFSPVCRLLSKTSFAIAPSEMVIPFKSSKELVYTFMDIKSGLTSFN